MSKSSLIKSLRCCRSSQGIHRIRNSRLCQNEVVLNSKSSPLQSHCPTTHLAELLPQSFFSVNCMSGELSFKIVLSLSSNSCEGYQQIKELCTPRTSKKYSRTVTPVPSCASRKPGKASGFSCLRFGGLIIKCLYLRSLLNRAIRIGIERFSSITVVVLYVCM